MFLPEAIDKIELGGIWRQNEYFDSVLLRGQMKPIVGFVYVAILSFDKAFSFVLESFIKSTTIITFSFLLLFSFVECVNMWILFNQNL